MMAPGGTPVPLRFDLSALVRASVASLYSNLVTRPTGQAIRLGIEAQIHDLGGPCLSVLDFSEVVVLDFSCADEAVAKLIRRYQREPAGHAVYFMARGLCAVHREAVEAVLLRHGLALSAEFDGCGSSLLGEATQLERDAWAALDDLGSASSADLLGRLATSPADLAGALRGLHGKRLILAEPDCDCYHALSSLACED